jgi:hypothetical protein
MKRTDATARKRHPRLSAFCAALVLLAVAWPAFAAVALTVAAAIASMALTHLSATATITAGLLLLRATGPTGHRAITWLAGPTAARLLTPQAV